VEILFFGLLQSGRGQQGLAVVLSRRGLRVVAVSLFTDPRVLLCQQKKGCVVFDNAKDL
jgi:hypothetical protein